MGSFSNNHISIFRTQIIYLYKSHADFIFRFLLEWISVEFQKEITFCRPKVNFTEDFKIAYDGLKSGKIAVKALNDIGVKKRLPIN